MTTGPSMGPPRLALHKISVLFRHYWCLITCFGPEELERERGILHKRFPEQRYALLSSSPDAVFELSRFVRLVEDVKELGGDVHIFSSMHVSGEQLKQLTGIAAILRFPCPQITDGGEA
mmetsp:Transcript_6752/g.24976  ORF Transcript_6752/g.24976 Transcript_6752/m.24976 type:complete len:119 (+) Transcript_6752:1030-1386(+)